MDLRSLVSRAAAGGALAAGAVLLFVPAAAQALGRGAWPPLHARCIGVMALAVALCLALARRTLDAAALRIPLQVSAAWAMCSALALLRSGAPPSLPTLGLAAAGVVALGLARIDDGPSAPAQHADWLLLAWAVLGGGVALGIVLAPDAAASHWPWRLGAGWVLHYAPLFAAWAVAAALAARERRRYVRAPVLWALLAWALGTLGATLWHGAALRWSSVSAWLWCGALAGVALSAAQRLGLARHLGLRSRDGGTAPPPQ